MRNAAMEYLWYRRGARQESRVGREKLLHRAVHLPAESRAIVTAFLELEMPVRELAVLHRSSPRQMRRRVDRLRETLSDPCFLLAAQYGGRLPAELRALTRAYWLEGRTLRELARLHRHTLHWIRQQIVLARSLLLIALSVERAAPGDLRADDEEDDT